MPRVLPGVLAATEHVVVVDNQSDDGTADVSRQTAEKLGLSDKLTVLDYPFAVSRCGLEHLWTPERSVHSLAYFYNWSFAQVATEYSMKWDGDMVLTPEGIAIVRDLGWQLTGDVLVTMPRHPLFVESDSVAYLNRGTSNIEPYVFPMASGYGHVKAFEWEIRLHPEDITRIRLPEGICVELKYLDADEFAHWTAPDSFENPAAGRAASAASGRSSMGLPRGAGASSATSSGSRRPRVCTSSTTSPNAGCLSRSVRCSPVVRGSR